MWSALIEDTSTVGWDPAEAKFYSTKANLCMGENGLVQGSNLDVLTVERLLLIFVKLIISENQLCYSNLIRFLLLRLGQVESQLAKRVPIGVEIINLFFYQATGIFKVFMDHYSGVVIRDDRID